MLLFPSTVDDRGKAIRRILIFDNHPETLRLLQISILNGSKQIRRRSRLRLNHCFSALHILAGLLMGRCGPVAQPYTDCQRFRTAIGRAAKLSPSGPLDGIAT